jgi:hypothetical protein
VDIPAIPRLRVKALSTLAAAVGVLKLVQHYPGEPNVVCHFHSWHWSLFGAFGMGVCIARVMRWLAALHGPHLHVAHLLHVAH